METKDVISMSDEQVVEVAHQLRVAYQLKRTLRYATERNFSVHSESVAEHVFALLYLTHYFLPLEDPEGKLDVAKVHSLLLFHDFGEIAHGDIPYHLKTREHEEREQEAAKDVFASLPHPLGAEGYEYWKDYEFQKSPEAQFVYALDKVEPLFELLDPVNERSMHRLKFGYEVNIERKLKATQRFPVMRRFAVALSDDMRRRSVFWVEKT
jgi:putative hydrolase of HD superfamily